MIRPFITTRNAVALAITVYVFGILMAVGFATTARADNGNGIGADYSLSRDCVDNGDRVCAPGNLQGVPAGCYDDGGVLAHAWPCSPWHASDGYRHGDGTVTVTPDVLARALFGVELPE